MGADDEVGLAGMARCGGDGLGASRRAVEERKRPGLFRPRAGTQGDAQIQRSEEAGECRVMLLGQELGGYAAAISQEGLRDHACGGAIGVSVMQAQVPPVQVQLA